MFSRFPDLVVVIPGLIGSVLKKDGKSLWGTSPGALWRTVAGDALEQLRLKSIDTGDDDLGDGIEATSLVSNVEMIPGLWKVGGYSILGRTLTGNLALEPGKNYFEFAYDWRRDNRVSARKLARCVTQWLSHWREESGNQDAKLVFVVHSMGGLVARYYIECLEGWRTTKLLVSFGTPYRGSGNALGYLSNGFSWDVGPFQAFDGTAALRSFDSVYQLLPTYPFVNDGRGTLSRVGELDLPNIDRARANAAAAFHEDIRQHNESNAKLDAYRKSAPTIRPVIGTDQPTFQSARLSTDNRLEMLLMHEGKDLRGDRTVPRVSAIPIETPEAFATYLPTSHSELQSEDFAIGHACGVLSGVAIDLEKYRKTDAEGVVALNLSDAYFANRRIQISATTSQYTQLLNAQVERLDDDSAAPINVILRPSSSNYEADLNLEAGLYRVSVSGKSFKTIKDVFLVANE